MKIASYCHQGVDKSGAQNAERMRVLDRLIEKVSEDNKWHGLDALILPGGFFEIDQQRIEASPLFPKLKRLARHLSDFSPGAHLVIGVDTKSYTYRDQDFGGQQLCVAFNEAGISGFARKICPVGEDVDGEKWPAMIVYETDFTDESRYIKLASGGQAALCVCYDMFGLADTIRGKGDKFTKVALVEEAGTEVWDDTLLTGREAAQKIRCDAFPALREDLRARKDDIAATLACIHRFKKPGNDVFWQRHGIASASSAFNGAPAIGAAHFGVLMDDVSKSTLAAQGVPKAHLEAGMKRQLNKKEPHQAAFIEQDGQSVGLLRLFCD